MNTIKNIALHHAGGFRHARLASSLHLTADRIDNAHRQRWNFESSLGHFGGYNVFIDQKGTLTQFRAIGEETAAQRGSNFDTFSICLAGNFSLKNGTPVDMPTKLQIQMVKHIIFSLLEHKNNPEKVQTMTGLVVAPNTTLDFAVGRIYPHRFFTAGTECYGMALADSWARNMGLEFLVKKLTLLRKILMALYTQTDKLKRMKFAKIEAGSIYERGCPGLIELDEKDTR